MDVRVGCCGFSMSREKYFARFRVVEIQQTFYQLPRLETAERWREEAPPGFEYTMKAWQLITHEPSSPTYRRLKEPLPDAARTRYGGFKDTEEVWQAWERTAEFAAKLGARVLVFQCPASFRPTDENVANLKNFFTKADRQDFVFVWEPRGSWPDDLVKSLCDELHLVHCVDPLKAAPLAGEFRYFRLHGRTGYRYVHTEEDFHQIRSSLDPARTNYVLFNNVQMADDAGRFLDYLRQRGET
ncbi:MAG: DUF72 domain-containing protein [Calditrichaeota bacterium]|nr:DUF72 domain-containing protein [Calditrichota bacterium]